MDFSTDLKRIPCLDEILDAQDVNLLRLWFMVPGNQQMQWSRSQLLSLLLFPEEPTVSGQYPLLAAAEMYIHNCADDTDTVSHLRLPKRLTALLYEMHWFNDEWEAEERPRRDRLLAALVAKGTIKLEYWDYAKQLFADRKAIAARAEADRQSVGHLRFAFSAHK